MDFLQYCRRLSGDEGYSNTLGTTTGDGPNMISKYHNNEEPAFDRDDGDVIVYDPPSTKANRPNILEDRIPPPPKRKTQRYHKPHVTR